MFFIIGEVSVVVVWFFAPTTFLKHHHSFSNPEIKKNYAVVELRIAWGTITSPYLFSPP
jgi:hypothetical protein